MSTEEGLALFDAARGPRVAAPAAHAAGPRPPAGRPDRTPLPALLRGLVAAPRRGAAAAGDADLRLAGRLAGLSATEQERLLTGLVRATVAAVLGHTSAETIDPGAPSRTWASTR